MKTLSGLIWLFTSVALLCACAGLLNRPEPPNIYLTDVQMLDMSLFEQRYRLRLRVQNPNDFPLPISGMNYTVEINGRDFAEGVSPRSVTIPAFGEEVIEVDAVSNLARVVDQVLDFGREQSLRYRLSGSLRLDRTGIARLPFDYQGELSLGSGFGRGGG